MGLGGVGMRERELITLLREIFKPSDRLANELRVGIGDDAAVFAPGKSLVATSTDVLTEGVHFNRTWSDAKTIGRKAAIANLADIFAMGMRPNFLLVSATIENLDDGTLLEIAQGIQLEVERVGAQVIGGDLSSGQGLTLSITAFGEGDRSVRRSDAKPGDDLYLTRLPGRSLLGLTQLNKGIRINPESVNFHLIPECDWATFEKAGEIATAMIDISDGVAKDGLEIAQASGVCLEIESELLFEHPDFPPVAKLAAELGLDVLETILSSGEEHTPLFTASPSDRSLVESFAHRVGGVSGDRAREILLDGAPLKVEGFDHFS